ncbi:MAG: hypothetical protein ACW967_07505 [Candidatus Hodarchaeales archaeon]|jgi:hypothetical protein
MSWAILKDSIEVYRHANIRVFTRAGLVSSIILIIFFSGIQFLEINIGSFKSNNDPFYVISYLLLAFLSALFTSSLFWMIGKNYGPKIGNLLVTNKILKIVLTKGDSHYFEKMGVSERKITPALSINKFINLLLTWLAVVAFLIGIFIPLIGGFPFFSGPGFTPGEYITDFFNANFNNLAYYFIKIIFVLFVSPLLLLIVIPIPWMLIDTQLKSYSSGPRINHVVGRLVQQRLTSLFAIGGIVSLILVNQDFDFYFALIGFILFFIGLPVALVSFFYNLLFQLEYYDEFIKIIPVPLGITSVAMESKITKLETETSPQQKDTEIKENNDDLIKENSDNIIENGEEEKNSSETSNNEET